MPAGYAPRHHGGQKPPQVVALTIRFWRTIGRSSWIWHCMYPSHVFLQLVALRGVDMWNGVNTWWKSAHVCRIV